jgi:predicted  nucleic acid-binding Zn-ribbon protein
MARDEYDKEVALRRDAERQMDVLRNKFLDQAKRLAQVDQEQRTAENLKRQSKDLRNSVVGIQKHLSELKTEVALSTAQIAELAALGKDECVLLSHLPSLSRRN